MAMATTSLPLFDAEVGAGRIVAAGVQQHDAVGGQAVEVGLHLVEGDALALGIVVGVGADGEAGGFEDGAVVFPARVADVELSLRQQAAQVVGADLERAGAAQASKVMQRPSAMMGEASPKSSFCTAWL